eukprot:SAG22_NODE_891_length_6647_cov_30.391723_1_plen_926_part_00
MGGGGGGGWGGLGGGGAAAAVAGELAEAEAAEQHAGQQRQEADVAMAAASKEAAEAAAAEEAAGREAEEARLAQEAANKEEEEAQLAQEAADREQEEARLAQEAADAEEEEARLAEEAAQREQQEAREAQEKADREHAEVAAAQERVAQAKQKFAEAKSELQTQQASGDATSIAAAEAALKEAEAMLAEAEATLQRETDEATQAQQDATRELEEASAATAKAAEEKAEAAEAQRKAQEELAEASVAQAKAAEEKAEAAEAQRKAQEELAEAKAAELHAEKERAEALEAQSVAAREQFEADLAEREAEKERAEAETAGQILELEEKLAAALKGGGSGYGGFGGYGGGGGSYSSGEGALDSAETHGLREKLQKTESELSAVLIEKKQLQAFFRPRPVSRDPLMTLDSVFDEKSSQYSQRVSRFEKELTWFRRQAVGCQVLFTICSVASLVSLLVVIDGKTDATVDVNSPERICNLVFDIIVFLVLLWLTRLDLSETTDPRNRAGQQLAHALEDVRKIEQVITQRIDEDGEDFALEGRAPLPGRFVAEHNLISWASLDEARSGIQAILLEFFGVISAPEDSTRIAKIVLRSHERNEPLVSAKAVTNVLLLCLCLLCILFDIDSVVDSSVFGTSHTSTKGSAVDVIHTGLMCVVLVVAIVTTVGVLLTVSQQRLPLFKHAVKLKWTPRIHCVHEDNGKAIVASSQLDGLTHKLLISNHGNAALRVFRVTAADDWIQVVNPADPRSGGGGGGGGGKDGAEPPSQSANVGVEIASHGAALEITLRLLCAEPGTYKPGVYQSTVRVVSDDPMIPTVVVPVQIEVSREAPPLPSVSTGFLSKTVPFHAVLHNTRGRHPAAARRLVPRGGAGRARRVRGPDPVERLQGGAARALQRRRRRGQHREHQDRRPTVRARGAVGPGRPAGEATGGPLF